MKGFRIITMLIIGVVYIGYTMANPDDKWMARGAVVIALVALGLFTRLIAGKEAAEANPLEADPIPTLNLSQRAFDGETSTNDRPRS